MFEHLRTLLDHDVTVSTGPYQDHRGTLKDVGVDWAVLSLGKDTDATMVVLGFYSSSVCFTHKPKKCARCRG